MLKCVRILSKVNILIVRKACKPFIFANDLGLLLFLSSFSFYELRQEFMILYKLINKQVLHGAGGFLL